MPLVTRTGQVSFAPKGDKGDKGARMRMRVWGASVSYLEGKQGQQFYDIVLYDNLLYLCIRSHTSVSTETPKQNVASGKIKYWEVAQSWTFIATKLLLTEKIKANFYSQNMSPAAPQPRQNEKPAATKISGKEILEAIRLMDADERRELTRALFA